MKIIVNLFFLLGIFSFMGLYFLMPDYENNIVFMFAVIAISITSIILNLCWIDKRNYKVPMLVSITMILALYITLGIYVYSIREFYGEIYLNAVSLFKGKSNQVANILEKEVTLYENEKNKMIYNPNDKMIHLLENNNEKIKEYLFSFEEVSNEESNLILDKYNGVKEINKGKLKRMLAVIAPTCDVESQIVPYAEFEDGLYKILGNENEISDAFYQFFCENNIYTDELFELKGTITDPENGKKYTGTIEKYFMDENAKELFNGKKVYANLYLCTSSKTKSTRQKVKEYLDYLKKYDNKNTNLYIEKIIKFENAKVPEAHIYYYNNLQTPEFIEIIFAGKEDSLFICETDEKFSYPNIENNKN